MIVVTGATGNVGRALVRVLTEAGEDVTAVSRGTATMALPDGVRHQRADLADPESLRPALAGADALFLMAPGNDLDPRGVVDVVSSAGISRIVLLSSQVVSTRPQAASHAPLRRIEETIEQSGLEWTHLRPGAFASNALAWAPSVRAEHTIAAPFADVALPVVDPQDIAETAATALRRPGHGRKTYVLTGPDPISPRQRAQIIGDVLGRPITFVELTRAQARDRMSAAMPEPLIEGTLAFNGEPAPEEQQVSPDVATVLGRSPHKFADWARRAIAAFRDAPDRTLSGPRQAPN
jgi:uncharacterized protein YbjT (DUF2867 family)